CLVTSTSAKLRPLDRDHVAAIDFDGFGPLVQVARHGNDDRVGDGNRPAWRRRLAHIGDCILGETAVSLVDERISLAVAMDCDCHHAASMFARKSAAARAPPSELVESRVTGPLAQPFIAAAQASSTNSGPDAAPTSPQQSAGVVKAEVSTNRSEVRASMKPN